MTFVGKILVIVIMAFALLFLGISTVVFTTATDWKKLADAQTTKVRDLTAKNKTATDEINSLKKDVETVKEQDAATKKTLDDKIAALNADIDRMQKEITAARGELVTAQQNSRSALDEAEASRKETTQLRADKLAVEKQANDFKLRQTELNDNIRQLTRELAVAKKNADDLRDRASKFSQLLRDHNLSDNITNIKGLASPPTVEGRVLRVDAANKRIELSIGSDDGLVPGHILELYRLLPNEVYLGKVQVISVDPDQAVASVIKTTVQGRKIKEGDIVADSIHTGPRS
ncbi:hypothetical protein ACYOEI_12340 [Singulisphaera rosea]